jgi:hypothetical protein
MKAAVPTTYLRSFSFLALAILLAGSVVSQELVVVRRPAAAAKAVGTEDAAPCPDRSQIVRLSPDGSERLLTDGFVAACDPAVSFDGRQILFAGRRSNTDRFQIWRMDADGGAAVQITDDPGDAFAPLWVGSLFHLNDDAPTERIAYLATGHGWIDRNTGGPIAALYTSDVDGANPWRISYLPSSVLEPDVLANGRLLFAAWRGTPAERDASRRDLMAINNDGTDLMAFHDNHDGPPYPHAPRVGRDGRVYFVEADGESPLGGGDLAYVTLRRPLHSRTLFAASGNSAFLDPLPLADGGVLASYRPAGDTATYGLYRIDPVTGKRLGLVHAKVGFDTLDAQELAPHPRAQGRSSVVDLSKKTGVFFCVSSHTTDRPGFEHLKDGGAATLRVIRGVPRTEESLSTASGFEEKTLGEAPIEDDGSFHIEVPSGVPLRFELLAKQGGAVAEQDSWTWVMPREWRGCIGCHEDREMVVPNKMADAFVKPAVPLGLTAGGEE